MHIMELSDILAPNETLLSSNFSVFVSKIDLSILKDPLVCILC